MKKVWQPNVLFKSVSNKKGTLGCLLFILRIITLLRDANAGTESHHEYLAHR